MAGTNIDGFRLYRKTDEGDEFIAEIAKTVRSKEFMRTMATGMYGISAYKIVADVIDPSKKTMLESIKRYFTVNPFYRIIIKDTIIESETVTVKWGNETNVNYFDGYQIFRINKVGDEVTYDLVDTIESDEVSEYVFMRDDDTTYNYVISPKTYDGFHAADSSYVEVLFVVIPPVTLLDPIDAVTYTARWEYEGDDDPTIELPPNTFRFQWEKPIASPATDERFTLTQVDDRTWDYTVLDEYLNTNTFFHAKFKDLNNKVELLAVGDISGITGMNGMFNDCASLTSVPLFDTSNITGMNGMFWGCVSLTTVPLFDTSNVTDMTAMFEHCTKVQSGALALYQQASATGKVTSHIDTFKDCGKDTETGLAELQQIPEDWGGLYTGGKINDYTFRLRYSDGINPFDYIKDTDLEYAIDEGYVAFEKVQNSDYNDYDITVLKIGEPYPYGSGIFGEDINDYSFYWKPLLLIKDDIKIVAMGEFPITKSMTILSYDGFDCNTANVTEMCDIKFGPSLIQCADGAFSALSKVSSITLDFNNCENLKYVNALFGDEVKAETINILGLTRNDDSSCLIRGLDANSQCNLTIEYKTLKNEHYMTQIFDTSSDSSRASIKNLHIKNAEPYRYEVIDGYLNFQHYENMETFTLTNIELVFQNNDLTFNGCEKLTHIPDTFIFDVEDINDIWDSTLYNCYNLDGESLLRVYDELKDKLAEKEETEGYVSCENIFTGAGTNTESGRAARSQIPSKWGGDGA